MLTFTREIKFLSREFNTVTNSNQNEDGSDHYQIKTKPATFNELSRTEKSQQKLAFDIVYLFTTFGEKDEDGNDKVTINGSALHELTIKCIRNMFVPTPEFTLADKEEFLKDSGAMIEFGLWLMGEKISPFFQQLMVTLEKT